MKAIKRIILALIIAFLILLTMLEVFSFTGVLASCFSQLKPETFLYALSSGLIALSINAFLIIYLIKKMTGKSYYGKHRQSKAKQTCTDIITVPESAITIIDTKIEKH